VTLPEQIVSCLRQALGPGEFALHEPRFKGKEQAYVADCIASTFVSSVGEYVSRFEAELAHYTGARRAVATVSGTAALQVALQLAGVVQDDEVLMPALSFVATANAARYLHAHPHFIDNAQDNLGVDPEALRGWLDHQTERSGQALRNRSTGRRIRALVPMHTFGHPCQLDDLLAVARDFDLVLVEDAAESLGSFYQGQHTGTFGRLGALSFNGNKIVTCGGGGAILTNDNTLADHAKHLTTTAKLSHAWDYVHDEVGYNFRMPNLNAALGCAQLEQLPQFLESKRQLTARYKNAFSEPIRASDVKFIEEPEGCRSNYWLQTIVLSVSRMRGLESVLSSCNAAGYKVRPAWRLLHRLEPYTDCPKAPLPVAESLAGRIVNLPSSVGLG
jgi:perosamine synthetase